MARLTEEEKRELLSVGPSLARCMASIKRGPRSPFHKSDGTVDYVALTSFLNQTNLLLGHPRKPFCPIEGDRFLL
jgi:hypothetical protein